MSAVGGRRGSSRADRASLSRYLTIINERRWLVLGCTLLVTAIAAAYVARAPRRYQAQSQLLVQAAPSSNTTLSSLPVIHQTGDPTEDVLTGATLVTTPQVAQNVIRSLRLHTTTGALLNDVSAAPVGQTGFIAIQARADSAAQAERIANGFAQQTIATTTGRLHQALASLVPALSARVAALPPGQRNGPGSLGDELTQLELLQHQSDPTLQVATLSQRPSAPYTPKTKLALIAGVIGGLLLGIAAAFAFHAFDPRLRRPEQLTELFDFPVLAEVPLTTTARRTNRPLLPNELSILGHESYRALRTALAIRGRGHSHAVLITGSMPSEGKTTTAINLAAALSQGGLRVILVEADLRRPRFAAAFSIDQPYGIEHVLTGQAKLTDAMAAVSLEEARFNVIPAHGAGERLADRLTYPAAKKLMTDLRALCDFVIVDSPPLTAVLDALPLAQLVDDLLIVARLNRTKLSQLSALDEILTQHVRAPAGYVVIGESRSRRRSRDAYYSTYIQGSESTPEPEVPAPAAQLTPVESRERAQA